MDPLNLNCPWSWPHILGLGQISLQFELGRKNALCFCPFPRHFSPCDANPNSARVNFVGELWLVLNFIYKVRRMSDWSDANVSFTCDSIDFNFKKRGQSNVVLTSNWLTWTGEDLSLSANWILMLTFENSLLILNFNYVMYSIHKNLNAKKQSHFFLMMVGPI